jgi:hypothetical protein
VPDILKYSPKRFWGMFTRGSSAAVSISSEEFARFN